MIELEEGLLVVLLFKPYGFGFPPDPGLFCYGVIEPWYNLLVSNACGLHWGMGIQSIPKNLVLSLHTVVWRQGVEVIQSQTFDDVSLELCCIYVFYFLVCGFFDG